jgi:hypothetical protein
MAENTALNSAIRILRKAIYKMKSGHFLCDRAFLQQGDTGSITGQCIWNLKHWNQFFCEQFSFALPIFFPPVLTIIYPEVHTLVSSAY